jgi:hypothetical protein
MAQKWRIQRKGFGRHRQLCLRSRQSGRAGGRSATEWFRDIRITAVLEPAKFHATGDRAKRRQR